MDRSDINNEQHTLSLNHSQLTTQTLFKSLPRFVDGTQDHDFNSARFRMEGARDDKKIPDALLRNVPMSETKTGMSAGLGLSSVEEMCGSCKKHKMF